MQHAYGLDVPLTLEDACDPGRMALIVYDMQVGVVGQIANGHAVTERVLAVLESAREAGVRVVFTRHMSLPNEVAGASALRTAMAWQRVSTVSEVHPALARGSAGFEIVPELRPLVLIVVANPTTATTTGLPVGFWAAELLHPFHEFTNKRYDVTIASPEGGRVEVDALSDPRDESRWSADDLISMGALNTPEITGLLENTPALRDLDLDRFDAIVVAGGQAPMFQYRDHEDLKRAIACFYESGKPTGVLCHGVSAL